MRDMGFAALDKIQTELSKVIIKKTFINALSLHIHQFHNVILVKHMSDLNVCGSVV